MECEYFRVTCIKADDVLSSSIAGQIYRSTDQPRYLLGHATSLAFFVVGLLALTVEWSIWRIRNAKRDVMSQEEKDAQDAKGIEGDHHYDFRYVL